MTTRPRLELLAIVTGVMMAMSATAMAASVLQVAAPLRIAVLVAAAASLIVTMPLLWAMFRRTRPSFSIAHNIAIIGFPQSGKTTLITSLFAEIFAKRVLGLHLDPSGGSTIDRVNQDLARLETGVALGPTGDQERFSYRCNMEVYSFLFPRTYKVEFGDFPGGDSRDYAERDWLWLHDTPFFKWVEAADALVFVVDLGAYLRAARGDTSPRAFVAHMSAAIRGAWQHYVDSIEGGAAAASRRAVVLAFTKADLCDLLGQAEDDRVLTAIAKLGFGDTVPPVRRIDTAILRQLEEVVQGEFADLITYLRSQTRHFSVIFTSCFGTLEGRRLGLAELLKAVLPR